MNKLENLKLKRKKLDKQIKDLEEQEKLEKEQSDFQIIKYKGKEYRIYKWENKPIKDFVCPQGFEMAGALDLIKLINEKKLIGEIGCSYFAKKLLEEGHWDLFRVYFSWGDGWYAGSDSLADSDDDGRVVCVRSER